MDLLGVPVAFVTSALDGGQDLTSVAAANIRALSAEACADALIATCGVLTTAVELLAELAGVAPQTIVQAWALQAAAANASL